MLKIRTCPSVGLAEIKPVLQRLITETSRILLIVLKVPF